MSAASATLRYDTPMSGQDDKAGDDNIVRVDFRQRAVVDEAGEVQEQFAEPEPEPTPEPATKLERFSQMLEHGVVRVTFDTRVHGVQVPESFQGTPQLHLNFSVRFNLDDFEYDARGVRGTLSFNSGEQLCVVPWPSVYVLHSPALDETYPYPESFPAELLAMLPALAEDEDDAPE